MPTIDYHYAVCVKHRNIGFEATLIKRRDGKPDYWLCPYGQHELHPAPAGEPQTILFLTRKGVEE